MTDDRPTIRVRDATGENDWPVVREMFLEYAGSLDFGLDFQDFESEVASLPGEYAPPGGCVLLAEVGGETAAGAAPRTATAGCVAMRPFSQGICEMKRLYVRPGYRGLGIGVGLSRAIIKKARERGYEHMRLDTVASMVEATRLYEALGFREIEPYRHNPLPGARFFELRLTEAGTMKG